MSACHWGGAWAALAPPFGDAGVIDFDALARHEEKL